MIFNDDFEGVPIFLGAHLAHDVLPDLLGGGHALHDLQVGDFLLQHVFVSAQLQRLHHLRQLPHLRRSLRLLPVLIPLQDGDLPVLLTHLQNVQRVLLLDLHHRPPQLYALVEILEYLLLDRLHLLLLVNTSAVAAHPIAPHRRLRPVATVDSGQFIAVVLIVGRSVGRAVVGEAHFKLFDFSVEVVDDVFVLTDVQRH